MNISQFRGTRPAPQNTLSIDAFLDRTKKGNYKDFTEKCREIKREKGEDAYKKAKRGATSFAISGTFEKRKSEKLIKHSGFICIDMDDLPNVEAVKEELIKDQYSYAVFKSIGGDGLAVLVKIDPAKHLEAFLALEKYYKDKYNIEIDENCKDVGRIRFASFDPELSHNKGSSLFDTYIQKEEVKPVAPPATPPQSNHNPFDTYIQVSKLCNDIERAGYDLTNNDYGRYRNIGFSLASEFGESGRALFHQVCRAGEKYDNDIDTHYSNFCKSKGSSQNTISTFFHYAKEANFTYVNRIEEQRGKEVAPLPIVAALTPFDEVVHKVPAIVWNGSTFLKRGEVGTIVALPGVGKSNILEVFHASTIAKRRMIETSNWGLEIDATNKGVSIHIDTERPKDDCIINYRRIFQRVNDTTYKYADDLIYIPFGDLLRLQMWEELEKELSRIKNIEGRPIDLVTIDGILEFCIDMNDQADAQSTVQRMRRLAIKYDTSIIVTMHPNKNTSTMAGHIGAMLYRYCRGIVLMRKADEETREITTDFEQGKLSHASHFQSVYFKWDYEMEMMNTCEAPTIVPHNERRKKDAYQKIIESLMVKYSKGGNSEYSKYAISKFAGVSRSTLEKYIDHLIDDSIIMYNEASKKYSINASIIDASIE